QRPARAAGPIRRGGGRTPVPSGARPRAGRTACAPVHRTRRRRTVPARGGCGGGAAGGAARGWGGRTGPGGGRGLGCLGGGGGGGSADRPAGGGVSAGTSRRLPNEPSMTRYPSLAPVHSGVVFRGAYPPFRDRSRPTGAGVRTGGEKLRGQRPIGAGAGGTRFATTRGEPCHARDGGSADEPDLDRGQADVRQGRQPAPGPGSRPHRTAVQDPLARLL